MDLSVPPPSPCVRICVVDPDSGLCVGCGRTVEEITMWGELDAEKRRAVVAGLARRRETARSRPAPGRA